MDAWIETGPWADIAADPTPALRPGDAADAEAPLADSERAQAASIGRRLQTELRRVLDGLPQSVRGGSALARHLGLNRATAHRVAAAAVPTMDDEQVLEQAPGVQGLRQFIDAARMRDADTAALEALGVAVDRFERFIDEVGGSHAALLRRLAARTPRRDAQASDRSDVALRQRLFAGTADFLGRYSDCRVELVALRPSDTDDTRVERAWARGLLGYHARPGALPLSIVHGSGVPVERDTGELEIDPATQGDANQTVAHQVVLEAFSSKPLPIATVRGDDRQSIGVIETGEAAVKGAVDVIVGHREIESMLRASLEERKRDDMVVMVREATRYLVADVYLHRSLARGCLTSLEHYLWSPGGPASEIPDRWWDRLPNPPLLKVLGPGLANAAHDKYSKHAELSRSMFARAGWRADEFIGYRCEVEYPACGTCYVVRMDYGG